METLDIAGKWWLPGHDEAAVVGMLTQPVGRDIQLSIPVGRLGEPMSHSSAPPNRGRCPVVFGLLQDGERITLHDLSLTAWQSSGSGFDSETWTARLAFVGYSHVDPDPEICSISCILPHLVDWAGYKPVSLRPSEAGSSLETFDYHYELPAPVPLIRRDDWTLSIVTVLSERLHGHRSVDATVDCAFVVHFTEPVRYDSVAAPFITRLTEFAAFCLNRTLVPSSVSLGITKGAPSTKVLSSRIGPHDNDSWIYEEMMLLSMPRIGDRLTSFLERWITAHGDEGRAIALLADLLAYESAHPDLRFLAAAQTLETLARLHAHDPVGDPPRRQQPPVEYTGKTKATSGTPCTVRERPFRSLVRDLSWHIGQVSDQTTRYRERFLADLKDSRDFYAHRDDLRKKNIRYGRELAILTEGAIVLAKAAVLRRLGLSDAEVWDVMRDCLPVSQQMSIVASVYSTGTA